MGFYGRYRYDGPVDAPGLYLHVPFCARVCPYCDFAVRRDHAEERRSYVRSLEREAESWRGRWTAGSFDTVYFGGGTPSRLDPAELEAVLRALRAHLPITADAWVSLEANPEDATPERLAAYRALGVRTLSLGVQSFDAAALKFLGRRHRPEQAREAAVAARGAGFDIVSVDLIFGLPGESLDRLTSSLEAAAALGPEHVSCYQLTFHEGTPFGRALGRGRLAELPEPDQAAAFERVHEVLGAAGYEPYEVSNFARGPEFRSRHNQKYWRHRPYLGLGPSAHSFDGTDRFWNERDFGAWAERLARDESPEAGRERLGPNELALERLMLGLRTLDGVDLGALDPDFLDRNRATLERQVAAGLLTLDADKLCPTRAGLAVADGLVRELW
jgi:putative oxygen-independent coproporphyrinogen III oxidase